MDDQLIVYLNGEFLPVEKATISVLDRGFLLGDAVYEVMPVFHGKIVGLEQHFDRLKRSLNSVYMPLPIDQQQFVDIVARLMAENKSANQQSIYLQITRGLAPRGACPAPQEIVPTVFVRVTPVVPKQVEQGLRVITTQDIRWKRCDIKSVNRMANVMLSYQAKQQNCDDALLLAGDEVLEGTICNVFIVKNNQLFTAAKADHLLGGVTREIVIELAVQHQITCHQQTIKLQQLLDADEVWLTSSSYQIAPVIEIDGRPVANGKPGPLYATMSKYYQQHIDQL